MPTKIAGKACRRSDGFATMVAAGVVVVCRVSDFVAIVGCSSEEGRVEGGDEG